MSTIHIDENSGSDTTGNGTSEKPYQSLAQAIYSHGEGATFRIRKSSSSEYEEPTPSSIKKAKKNAQGIEKKKKKEEEQAERDAKKQVEETEKREKLLSESKKIILEEDPSLPKATKVCSDLFYSNLVTDKASQAKITRLVPLRGKRVRVFGWVHRLRDQKGIIFVIVRDGTGYLQSVLSGRVVCRLLLYFLNIRHEFE